MDARLILDSPAQGSWNMALDEALFQTAQSSRQVTFRFYQWSEPTLSLGYFQAAADREKHYASRDCPLVRRSTGGGAIVHDAELTYSLVCPIDHDRSAAAQRLVRDVHSALIDALSDYGIQACRFGEQASAGKAGEREPFLCFQRRTSDDLVIGEHKVVGSAQRRLHGTLLQHGSVLLGRSGSAPELPGIQDLVGAKCHLSQLMMSWTLRLGEKIGVRFQPDARSRTEEQLAGEIERAKYAAIPWNFRR